MGESIVKNNKKGITLVSLVITIIVILILAGTLFYSGNSIIKSANLQTISTNLLLIQAKAKTLSEKASFENDVSQLLGSTPNNEILEKLNLVNNDKIKILSQNDLNSMGLQKIIGNNKYIVNYEDDEIYYVDGYKDSKGNIYYKLSEITNITAND